MPAAPASRIRQELAQARAADQVHGAYLFAGPPGTGRRATALWLARLLLCRTPGDEPCGACGGCVRTDGLETGDWRHADLWVIAPEGAGNQIRIERVRDLQEKLSMVPNEGGRRVAVLFDVERLNPTSANALLKTLEEPPADATLVLVTASAGTLLPTIRSRATLFRFRPEPESGVAEALLADGLAEPDAWLAAALGGGSPDAARAWAEQHLETARGLREALEAAETSGASHALDVAESFRGTGERVRARCALFLAVHGALARRRISEAAAARDGAALERWLARAEAGARARRELAIRNLNPQLVVEGLMLDLVG